MATKSNKIETASVLSFARKIDPSDAVFTSGTWDTRLESDKWTPVTLVEKVVRGTISNRLPTNGQDPVKLNASIQNANIQTVDHAALPHNHDTLKVKFTIRVLGNIGDTTACNSAEYQARLTEVVSKYRETYKFMELAKRYCYNIACGNFLWRNRVGANAIEIHVSETNQDGTGNKWVFNGHSLPHDKFDFKLMDDSLFDFASSFANALSGNSHKLYEITAYVNQGEGQEVFPSQEMSLDRSRGDKSKVLYSVNGIAAMHSQKVGNAIRRIDTWYDSKTTDSKPISVESYGSVTTEGMAYRTPQQKIDFYNLLDKWMIKDEEPETTGNKHYVMAMIIRGGVFGESKKDKE